MDEGSFFMHLQGAENSVIIENTIRNRGNNECTEH